MFVQLLLAIVALHLKYTAKGFNVGVFPIRKTIWRSSGLNMALDEFLIQKLDGIKRTFDALTVHLADPDISIDRKQMLTLSRERALLENTVNAYEKWKGFENERLKLIEMDQSGALDAKMEKKVRMEQKKLLVKQEKLEQAISLMLLPSDPNGDRNVMLEVPAGTGL